MTDIYTEAKKLDISNPIKVDTYPEPETIYKGRFIECKAGKANSDDYCIHFLSCGENKFLNKESVEIFKRHISKSISENIKVDIFLPDNDWSTDVITLMIRNANCIWSFDNTQCNNEAINAAKELEVLIKNYFNNRR